MITKWDRRFLEMAQLVSSWSKDPSTKVGSVVVRHDKTVASVGFNGFPRGVADTEARLCDRNEKLDLIVHAEINALSVAHESLSGCTLYCVPLPPCVRCATSIIQHGISRVVAPATKYGDRWHESAMKAKAIMEEAGLAVELVEQIDWSE